MLTLLLITKKQDPPTYSTTVYAPETISIPTENAENHIVAGGYNPRTRSVDSTTINGVELNSRNFPDLAPFMEVYAQYGYERGILGVPLGNRPISFLGGTYLQFSGQHGDNAFHAIAHGNGTTRAYALWGVIGDNWIHGGEQQWGYPISEVEEYNRKGNIITSQSFHNGLVTYSRNYGIVFTVRH